MTGYEQIEDLMLEHWQDSGWSCQVAQRRVRLVVEGVLDHPVWARLEVLLVEAAPGQHRAGSAYRIYHDALKHQA